MTFKHDDLLAKLAEVAELAGRPSRYVIAYSGGLDSTVMLHALVASRDVHQTRLTAVHIDHALHDDSAAWSQHCKAIADSLDVELVELKVHVDVDSGEGTEGAARRARYDAFRSYVRAGDWLLSAHHKDDQAETLLLNLMRGSGPAGLAGIGEIRPLAGGWLVRPLLSVARSQLQDYAAKHELNWIDDPSNEDRQYDRNYLRHEVLPRLQSRWPDVASRLKRSAVLAGEASLLLDQLADADFRTLGGRADRLALKRLQELPPARQRNVLRYVVRELGLPSPPATTLQSLITELIPARDDAQPIVTWPGAEIRRYRDNVYVLAASTTAESDAVRPITFGTATKSVALAPGLGDLDLEPGAPSGLADAVVTRGLELRYRSGGEEIKPLGQLHTRKLKKLLQEEGVVPWMRDKLPLVYSEGKLVAVADLWIAAGAASEPGTAIRWRNRPSLH
ncbi:MAG: tRNA lysidine(34) synthetase TilS [Gammaproteobacteria bacterium]|nr:tRNA lysidine(34) synthetase TilS [Gammaproteobacteria bacterium]MDH3372752.1 tRNA lysidine(34) synthetase TilS [Gammaproteobacteria bacterium]MDH3408893.1 tRNA lysidine(34) synthetase TilS [Gammaproteobacteria bacterium]MDH3553004.1 tRNA lysidine(34) synthetase TilS [Gammaproteobacteria bacterium]